MRCRTVVPDTHTGPCSNCGDVIVRVIPKASVPGRGLPHATTLPSVSRSESSWHVTTLITVAAAWVASSLFDASAVGWNAELAVNVWSLSVGYYALAQMEGGIG